MNYLVINRHPLTRRDYPSWIGPGHDITLITASDALAADPALKAEQLSGYAHVEVVTPFQANPLVEHLAIELHRRQPFDRIIGLAEFDVLRAARLRHLFGLPGQDPVSAEAFRDKFAMKEHLSAAGVPVAPYATVHDLPELVRFIDQHGYPVVVKPRRGGGSMGVQVLNTGADLAGLLEREPGLGGDDGVALMAEKYVDHVLYHIDGIYVDDRCDLIWPSTHGDTGCLDPMQGTPLISSMLDASDPAFTPVVELTQRAIAALPTPPTFLFHAEVFETPDGYLFNEIGSRMGGAMVEPAMQLGFGVTMPEVYVRAISGHEPIKVPAAPLVPAGWATLPPVAGTVIDIPQECPVPGVAAYQTYVEAGTVMQQAELSRDMMASVLATGPDRRHVEGSLTTAANWFQDRVEVKPT